jgi:hypothetical protein
MFDKETFTVSRGPVGSPGLNIRPAPEGRLCVTVVTPDYPAGIVGRCEDLDSAFLAVGTGSAHVFHGNKDARVALTPIGEVLEVRFTGHLADGSEGGFDVNLPEFRALIDHAIANRSGPREFHTG